MVDVTPFLPGLSPVQGKAVVARFDGGRLSSEGGLLALREIESRLRLADRLAAWVFLLSARHCEILARNVSPRRELDHGRRPGSSSGIGAPWRVPLSC